MTQTPLTLSPAALFAALVTTMRVMLGRQPATGSFHATPDGLWQAVGAAILLAVLASLYPGLSAAPSLFFLSIIVQLIGVLLLVLMINFILQRLGEASKFMPFAVPFLWVENVQQLLGGIVQNLMVISGDPSMLMLILPVAVWSIYWLWRLGRDIVGRGGGVAAGFVMLSFMIDLGLLVVLQSRLAGG
jgi:hypothetical protein